MNPTARDSIPPAPSPQHDQGFTLIEVLIVLAIVGVLMAVLIPNLTGARSSAYSKASAQFGTNVNIAVNGFMSSRPGLTAEQLISQGGWNAGGALPAGVSSSGPVKDCAAGYTLSGSAASPVIAQGGADQGQLPSWAKASDSVHCIITTDTGSNPYAVRVITWSDRKPGLIYANGRPL